MKASVSWRALWAAFALLAAPLVRAQFAVIDVSAITQLIEEIRILEEQLTTAREHLAQAREEYDSITGGRGMERLLSGLERNYLPANWLQLQGALQSAGGLYGVLAGEVAAIVTANTIVSPDDLAQLRPEVREQFVNARRLTALRQAVAREALATTSERFAALQHLIDAIASAADQKAVLDLQARIGAETTLMQNEQSKLTTLFQLVQAEQRANEDRMHELAAVGLGDFTKRFQPVP